MQVIDSSHTRRRRHAGSGRRLPDSTSSIHLRSARRRHATVDGEHDRRQARPAVPGRRPHRRRPRFGPLTIYAVTSLDSARRAERYLRHSLLIGLPLLVALAAWLIWWVVGRALAPVDAMRAEVDRIEAEDLSGRVEPGSSDDEIANLGLTLNRMLDRLEEASDRQQLFAAAASHELRSPLSTIRTELEVGLAYPDRAEWPKVAEDSLIEVDRLEELTRDLRTLTRSRSMRGDQRRRRSSCPLVVAGEVALRRPPRDVTLQTRRSPGATIVGDPDAVVQVVRNLFDNAERHAATEIRVAVDRRSRRSDVDGRQRRSADPGGRARAHLRAVHAPRRGTFARHRRQRARPGDRPIDHDCDSVERSWRQRPRPVPSSRPRSRLRPRRMNFGALALVIAAGLVGPLLAAGRFGPPIDRRRDRRRNAHRLQWTSNGSIPPIRC